ncbi:Crp/Fnr family transcriptional regulator [Acidobacteriota bacterium]
MIEIAQLKRIEVLEFLSDQMLEKLLPYLELVELEEGQSIFKDGDFADKFYMCLQGKVLLEERLSPKITVTIFSIKPGQAFGVSSLLEPVYYESDAICSEPSTLIAGKGEDILQLLEEDHSMGYLLMKRINMILFRYLQRRTAQFLRSLNTHPDIYELASEDSVTDKQPKI